MGAIAVARGDLEPCVLHTIVPHDLFPLLWEESPRAEGDRIATEAMRPRF